MSHHMNPRDLTRSEILQRINGIDREAVEALADCNIMTLADLAELDGSLDRRREIARIICVSSAEIDRWAANAVRLVG